jgi:hypothetical protein
LRKLERQQAWVVWALEQEWHYFATIQTNRPLREECLSSRLRNFGARCDRHWLGKHWWKFASGKRTAIFAVAETGVASGNEHLHMLVRRPAGIVVRGAWRQALTASGGVSSVALRKRSRVPSAARGKSGPCLHLRFERGKFVRVPENEQALLRAAAVKRRLPQPTTHEAEYLTREFTAWGRRSGLCPVGDVQFVAINADDEADRLRVAGYVLKSFSAGRNPIVFLGSEFHPASA